MMKHKYRGTKVLGGMAQPTDEIVENHEFTQRLISLVDSVWSTLSPSHQVVLQKIRAGYSLDSIAKEYQGDSKREEVYQDALNAVRSHVAPFARANGIDIPGTA